MKALKALPPEKAAGVLAEAALKLPYATFDANSLEEMVVLEAREDLNISPDDYSNEAIESISVYLDEVSDSLITVDKEGAFERLSNNGGLPSDLYSINVVSNVVDVYGDRGMELERDIISSTIRDPSAEQHFGPPSEEFSPALISIFVRSFKTKWPVKDFVVIVAAGRSHMTLNVHQSWRLYPAIDDYSAARTPLELLELFANKFGAEIDLQGKKGHFFLIESGEVPSSFRYQSPSNKRGQVVISKFDRNDTQTGKVISALIVAIDVEKYRSYVKRFSVPRQEILNFKVGREAVVVASSPSTAAIPARSRLLP